jgi:TetR/AcrR family transcriptional repressor of nem operon
MGRVSDAKTRLISAVLELIWTGSYGHTTIDQICDKAGVKKGSFYYFFHCKADLALAAFEAHWRVRQAELDLIFSPAVPPLQRLRHYCDFSYRSQLQIKRKYGRVLGCPLFAVGAEICTQEDGLRKKIEEILQHNCHYLESAVRDAHAGGWVQAPDPAASARMILAYSQGLLTQARIQNDASVLRETARGIFAMLGVEPHPARAA